jgi:peroxiredoxin Q/BCP
MSKQAPSFTLVDQNKEDVSLPEKGIVVLYFYPKGCTIEAKKFTEIYPDFIEAGAMVMGISPDPIDGVCKFSEKYDFSHTLLADPEHKVCEAYEVWEEKNMYGNKYMGVNRTTFVIKDQEILKEFKHKPGTTEQEVLEYVNNL